MSKNTLRMVFRIVMAVLAVGFAVLSIVTDKITPYLAISFACSAVANALNYRWSKEGYNPCRKTTSPED